MFKQRRCNYPYYYCWLSLRKLPWSAEQRLRLWFIQLIQKVKAAAGLYECILAWRLLKEKSKIIKDKEERKSSYTEGIHIWAISRQKTRLSLLKDGKDNIWKIISLIYSVATKCCIQRCRDEYLARVFKYNKWCSVA